MDNAQNKSKIVKEGSFIKALEAVIFDLPKRSQEIVWNRYGIGGGHPSTLEEIGKKFGITRERVRQVIREVCKKIKNKKNSPELSEIRKKILFTLESNSGIMKEESLLDELGDGDKGEKGAARFFLECLDDVKEFEIKGITEKAFALPEFDGKKWQKIKEDAVDMLKKKGSPEKEDVLFEEFSKNESAKGLGKKNFLDFLEVSLEIRRNTFGKWGLSEWKEIKPKGTRDKAYLILKEKGKPMHFREIAQGIDESGLNRKKTHPQTVHNELIKDDKFILVGRGIYALSEWGYSRGTVKDVLEEIFRKHPEGMKKEGVINEVLKSRQVKKSTIVINLNNYFKKDRNGVYTARK